MSITRRKSDLREIIHRKLERHIAEHPEEAAPIAIGAICRLSGKMTLRELQEWHTALFLRWPDESA